MFGIKPVLGIASLGLGAAAMAVAVYSQDPKAFTTRTAPPLPEPATAVVETEVLAAAEVDVPDDSHRPLPAMVDAEKPVRRATLRSTAAPASPAVQSVVAPCSEWREMESGPEGRVVRHLCLTTAPASASPVPGS